MIRGKEKKPRRVPRTALEQCRREYEIVVKERDEARETLRILVKEIEAHLTLGRVKTNEIL